MGRFLVESQATPTIPATDANPRNFGGSYSEKNNIANMDTNMVIVLAALLCALICALSLHSVLRCVLRCTRGSTDNEDQVNTNMAKGIKKRALKAIPVDSYSLELNMKDTECVICLGDFVERENIRVLPKCHHGFHVKCIDTWLLSHSSCPICRQSLLEHQTLARHNDGVMVAT